MWLIVELPFQRWFTVQRSQPEGSDLDVIIYWKLFHNSVTNPTAVCKVTGKVRQNRGTSRRKSTISNTGRKQARSQSWLGPREGPVNGPLPQFLSVLSLSYVNTRKSSLIILTGGGCSFTDTSYRLSFASSADWKSWEVKIHQLPPFSFFSVSWQVSSNIS